MFGRQKKPFAGFVRRFFAFAIDWLIISILVLVLATQFFDEVSALGQFARLIGLTLIVSYFGLLDSRAANGRTLGKRILGIRVVDGDGKPVAPARTTLRAIVLFLPIFLVGLDIRPLFPDAPPPFAVTVLGSLVVGGFVVAGSYLLLANTKTRQALHDLLTATYVVRTTDDTAIERGIAPVHLAVVLALFALSASIPFAPMTWFDTWQPARTFALIFKLRNKLMADRGFLITGIEANSQTNYANGSWQTTTSVVGISAKLHTPQLNAASAAAAMRKIAAAVLALEPDLMGYQTLSLALAQGADFGIASCVNVEARAGTVDEWRRHIADEAGPMPSDTYTSYVCSAPN